MKVRELTLTALLAALLAIVAPLSIPLSGGVPISLATLMVMLIGILLKPKQAIMATTAYLLLGAVGLPIFSNFRGGVGVLFGPTGGFLWMYPLLALLVSLSARHDGKWLPLRTTGAILAGHVLLYGCGTLWFAAQQHVTPVSALSITVLPFLPLDAAKVLAVLILYAPLKALMKLSTISEESQ